MAKIAEDKRDDRFPGRFLFYCPGCLFSHVVSTQKSKVGNGGPVWQWNGSFEAPTFRPSHLVTWNLAHGKKYVCHSEITEGAIHFLKDTTHALRGRTVPIPEWGRV